MGGIADVFDVRELPGLTPFDHLVIGSAIRMGKVRPELQQVLEKNKTAVTNTVRGLFTVGGNR
jgi:menaquinone-dependent protoporphyrinogen IX oxidase